MNIPSGLSNLFPVLAVGVFTMLCTEGVRRLALRADFVYRPVSDRWNRRVVPMGGGVGIHFAILLALFFFDRALFIELAPPIAALIIFGFADDLIGFMPFTKLGFQTLVAIYAVYSGYRVDLPWEWISYTASVLWILFITNAINLNDNMDGLVSGFLVSSGLGLALIFGLGDFPEGNLELALLVTGAALGFLIHNFHPARIFMGDVGSLPFGFLVSVLTLRLGSHGGMSLVQMPLVLLMPIFDTLFVMSLRARDGKAVMKGGVDHTSHRLVRAGISEAGAAAVLHVLNLMGVVTAVAFSAGGDSGYLVLALTTAAFLYFGLTLLRAEKSNESLNRLTFIRTFGEIYYRVVLQSRRWLGLGATKS